MQLFVHVQLDLLLLLHHHQHLLSHIIVLFEFALVMKWRIRYLSRLLSLSTRAIIVRVLGRLRVGYLVGRRNWLRFSIAVQRVALLVLTVRRVRLERRRHHYGNINDDYYNISLILCQLYISYY